MAPPDRPWWIADDGLVVRLRVTPKSSRDAIQEVEMTNDGPALKARVRAVPADGAANAAVERLVADWLEVARRNVALVSGGKSRVKCVRIAGDAASLAARIEHLLVPEQQRRAAVRKR